MKKLLPSAVLALVVSGFVTAQSFAGCCFGLCYKHCGCCGCGAKFCVRQYNAFSPVCCGTVFCNGCCPFGSGCGPGGYGGYGYGGGPCAGGMCGGGMCGGGMCPGGGCGMSFMGAPAGAPGGCCDGACLGSLPASEPGPGVPVGPGAPGAAASNPVVTPSPLPNGPTSQTINDRGIQNTSYRPVSYTVPRTVAPVRMQPQMMAAPSYWSN